MQDLSLLFFCFVLWARKEQPTRKLKVQRYAAFCRGGSGVVDIRILSPPVPLAFCFDSVSHLMDAVGRAVRTLHVLSSAMGRIGSRFFLCVTVRFSERVAARSLLSEYGTFLGAGRFTPAYLREHGDLFVPDAVAEMGRFLKKDPCA